MYHNTLYNEDFTLTVEKTELPFNSEGKKDGFLDNKEALGQVFTLPSIAQFMVKLLSKKSGQGLSILDPCMGPNTFPKHIVDFMTDFNLKSMEIDDKLITNDIQHFYQQANRQLVRGSFFDLPISEKFDAIIQNPPYVRHELLTKGLNNKDKILKSLSGLNVTVPLKSNLYIYFLLKTLLHLKENGKLVAITYDSWLYSGFGQQLKKVLLHFGQIEAIYHFKRNAFPNAGVGATIIEFTKTNNFNYENVNIDYFLFDTPENLTNDKPLTASLKLNKNDFLHFKGNLQANINFKNNLFCHLENISTVKPFRGLGTIANQYFIFDKPKFKATIPFVKDVIKIPTFSVEKPSKYILSVGENMDDILRGYLENVKQEVKNTPKLMTLQKEIAQNPTWYKVEMKQTGNIIFNYYLRKNIDFILNLNGLQVSDNFYVLNIKVNTLAVFALLNSTFSKLAIFENSRNQGSGLRKIQLFEFNKVRIINPARLDKMTLDALEKMGTQLSFANRFNGEKESIIEQIDVVLLEIYNNATGYNLTLEALQNDYQKILKNLTNDHT